MIILCDRALHLDLDLAVTAAARPPPNAARRAVGINLGLGDFVEAARARDDARRMLRRDDDPVSLALLEESSALVGD